MVHTKRITVLKKKFAESAPVGGNEEPKQTNKQTSLESQSSNLNVMTKGKRRTNIEWARDKNSRKCQKNVDGAKETESLIISWQLPVLQYQKQTKKRQISLVKDQLQY